jgi:hypothetical protein
MKKKIKVKLKKKIKTETCLDCSSHKKIADPDPFDWFRDGDQAVVCSLSKNTKMDKKSKYASDRQNLMVVQSLIGPWDWDDIKIPKWCPKKKVSKK